MNLGGYARNSSGKLCSLFPLGAEWEEIGLHRQRGQGGRVGGKGIERSSNRIWTDSVLLIMLK